MDEFKTFTDLSRALTGIETLGQMTPNTLQDRMARDYLHRLKEQFGDLFLKLLELFDSKSGTASPLAELLADPGFVAVRSMAKQVVNVWLLSQYRIETADKKGDDAPAVDAGYYEKGLIWPAIQAHPLGFSHGGYGDWAIKPL
jgi:hypothetical protein